MVDNIGFLFIRKSRASCCFVQQTYRCAVYAFVHCGEGGSALDMLEKMNAAGFTPAMTVPEVLIKVYCSMSMVLQIYTSAFDFIR